jgi:hypothetical protein
VVVEVEVMSAGTEEVVVVQSDQTYSELVVVVVTSAGTELVVVVQSDQTYSELLVVVVSSEGTELVVVVQSRLALEMVRSKLGIDLPLHT